MVKGIKHFTLFSEHFRSNFLSFDTFSKFEITPLQYFNGDPYKFHLWIFQNFTSSFFLKSRFSAINSVSPIYFIQKWLYWTHILRSPPFHYNHGEVWFFAHKYIRNTMNIKYAKIKKNSRSRFFKRQPARASLTLLLYAPSLFH